MQPGIYTDLDSATYHGDHASYSKTSLSDFSVYPLNLKFQRDNRVRKTIFDLGTAAHTAILEPEKWEKTIAVIPNDLLGSGGAKSTKACKDFIAEMSAQGKAVLTEAERDRVLRCRDSVHESTAHSKARELLTGGLPEVSCFWHEQFRGEDEDDAGQPHMISDQYYDACEDTHRVMFKARPDYLPANQIVVDLKTTSTAISKMAFEKHALSLMYHWSAALTLRGLSITTGKTHRIYIFVVVEIDPPHEVAIYKASEEFVAYGQKETMQQMERLAWCDKHSTWPGMPNIVQTVGLPAWAYKKLIEGDI